MYERTAITPSDNNPDKESLIPAANRKIREMWNDFIYKKEKHIYNQSTYLYMSPLSWNAPRWALRGLKWNRTANTHITEFFV
jgi:hypothetical protein